MLGKFFQFKDPDAVTNFKLLLKDNYAMLRILILVQLGKNLMCACRLHYNYINQEKPNPRVLERYIKFTSCTNHMNE